MTATKRRLLRLARLVDVEPGIDPVFYQHAWLTFGRLGAWELACGRTNGERRRAARLLRYWADRCRDVCRHCDGEGIDWYSAERCHECHGTGIDGWGR